MIIVQRRKSSCLRLLATLLIVPALAAVLEYPMFVLDSGAYLVDAHAYYRHPVTGVIDDPGQNEAIGQGMTESLLYPKALLEVDSSGAMYLTVRYSLMQYVTNVAFQTDTGTSISHETMQESGDTVDFRLPVSSTTQVLRGTAYIAPMGRDVVYFFTFDNPQPGSGDFITSLAAGGTTTAGGSTDNSSGGTQAEQAQEPPAGNETAQTVTEDTQTQAETPAEAQVREETDAPAIPTRTEQESPDNTVVSGAADVLAGAEGAQEVTVTGEAAGTVRTLSSTDSANKTGMIIMLTISGMLVVEAAGYMLYTRLIRAGRKPASAPQNPEPHMPAEKTAKKLRNKPLAEQKQGGKRQVSIHREEIPEWE